MIKIILDDNLISYLHDIRDLVSAFFPYKEIEIINEDSVLKNKSKDNLIFDKEKINIKNAETNLDKHKNFFYKENDENNNKELNYEENLDNKENNNDNLTNNKDIIIKDFYNGKIYKERKKTKDEIKKSLYHYLNKLTKNDLLWGTMTGIRPVNIITNLIENENIKDLDLIKKLMKDEYLISDEKLDEIIEIAQNELEILKKKEIKNYKDKFSIYIGVPFCKSTCLYCSFTSFNIDKWKSYVEKYLNALENELKIKTSDSNFDKNKILSLYVGGGTPTSLDDENFEKFLNLIDKYLYNKNIIEYTIEAGRPDTINECKLKLMKKFNVSRISINPQTFNQKTLDLIGRKHTIEDIKEKFLLARKLGLKNINMDIILGLPNEHLDDVVRTLIEVGKLKPESFTIHSLALKRASRLNLEKEHWENEYMAGLDNVEEMNNMLKCSIFLARQINLEPYYLYRQKNIAGNLENIGFAKKGKECIYNIMMMSERHSVFPFGLGTGKCISYKGKEKIIERIDGYKSVVDYVNKWSKDVI